MHLTPCVCNKILAPLYAGQTISSTLTPWSAAELTTPHGTNTTNRFVGQNKSKISFNVHADSYLPKKKQNLVLSNQHAGLSYQPKTKTNLGSLQSASWLSSRRKLLTSTPKATTQEQGKSWLCPVNDKLSNGKNQPCTHQSASTHSSPHQSIPLNLHPVHSTPIHTISLENTPFHSTPLHPRPVTCAAPLPRQSEILRCRRNGVSL